MADEKKKEPQGHHPYHDISLDKLVGDYANLHTEESELQGASEFTADVKNMTNMMHDALKTKYGLNDKTGALKKTGFYDMVKHDRRKEGEKLVTKLAGYILAKRYGKAYADETLKSNNRRMIEDALRLVGTDYHELIKDISDSKGLLEDGDIQRKLQTIAQRINTRNMNINELQSYFSNEKQNESYDVLKKTFEGKLKEYKLEHVAIDGITHEQLYEGFGRVMHAKKRPLLAESEYMVKPAPKKPA